MKKVYVVFKRSPGATVYTSDLAGQFIGIYETRELANEFIAKYCERYSGLYAVEEPIATKVF